MLNSMFLTIYLWRHNLTKQTAVLTFITQTVVKPNYMKISLLINPTHHWRFSINQALRLVQAMQQKNHHPLSVFFYGSAVKIATDTELQQQWHNITQAQNTQLFICRTMFENLNIKNTPMSYFQITGLAQLTASMEQSDKTVEIA